MHVFRDCWHDNIFCGVFVCSIAHGELKVTEDNMCKLPETKPKPQEIPESGRVCSVLAFLYVRLQVYIVDIGNSLKVLQMILAM